MFQSTQQSVKIAVIKTTCSLKFLDLCPHQFYDDFLHRSVFFYSVLFISLKVAYSDKIKKLLFYLLKYDIKSWYLYAETVKT